MPAASMSIDILSFGGVSCSGVQYWCLWNRDILQNSWKGYESTNWIRLTSFLITVLFES
jgi:hypothetical protein